MRAPVRIIGTGLLGASLGLRLRQLGVPVQLEDMSLAAQALARDLGAGLEQAGRLTVNHVEIARFRGVRVGGRRAWIDGASYRYPGAGVVATRAPTLAWSIEREP